MLEPTSEANADQREEKAARMPPSVSVGGAGGSDRKARLEASVQVRSSPTKSVQSLRQLRTDRLQKSFCFYTEAFFMLMESISGNHEPTSLISGSLCFF